MNKYNVSVLVWNNESKGYILDFKYTDCYVWSYSVNVKHDEVIDGINICDDEVKVFISKKEVS